CAAASSRSFRTLMTQTGHWPDRNPAVQQSPAIRGVLSFRSEARERPDSESTRVHHAARRRGGGMAACGAGAAGGDAGGWRTEFWHATVGRIVTLAKCAACSLIVVNCII